MPLGQVVVNYVAMTDKGRVFENSLEKSPFDVRVGAGQVLPGLDEGLASMKVGGVRRLYIPGSLAFPKPLKAAAGRCAAGSAGSRATHAMRASQQPLLQHVLPQASSDAFDKLL